MVAILHRPNITFAQIKHFVYELLPFLICIALIIVIWKEHYTFFLRYGLRDGKMIVLNTLFLIIVLFYVYPLKFLTRLILIPIAYLTNNQTMFDTFAGMIAGEDVGDLMIIYGSGAASVFFVMMLMYRYALKNAEALALNELEIFDTKVSIRANFLLAIVPVFSILAAILFYGSWYAGMISGFVYFLYTPIMMFHGKKVDRQRNKLIASSHQEIAPPPETSESGPGSPTAA